MFFPALSFTWAFVPQFVVFVLFLLCFVGAMLSSNNYKSEEQIKQEQEKQELEKQDHLQ